MLLGGLETILQLIYQTLTRNAQHDTHFNSYCRLSSFKINYAKVPNVSKFEVKQKMASWSQVEISMHSPISILITENYIKLF